MRIAVIGAGAVGCYYGARLARQGHEVRFLMRRDLEAVKRNGLEIRSCDGDFHIRAAAFGEPAEIGVVDLVLCSLKATSLDAAEGLIRPCAGPGTRILAMMNGLGIEERFAEWFTPEQVYGALAFVCINRGEPGVVHHTDYGRVVVGHLLNDRVKAAEVAQLFTDAGLSTSIAASLRQARWEKLMWNVPFNTLCVTAGGVTTDRIMGDAGLRDMARRLMEETAGAGNADGCAIDGDAMIQKMLANTGTMGPYAPSMLIDFRRKLPMEVDAILGEPVRRADKHGVAVPTMEAQYRLLAFLDRLNAEASTGDGGGTRGREA